ncbi:rhodanese-like domain-containing protein [Crocinitomicaceae bacterium CZZ-1]|uniref:Rhodanese-like domain-containing protein n=1 Tax=Taishania pollutisoli TaxID=2766479 RepID=A0A8J6TTQ2_9FLAO|nr:rhodanese-like domain-containing protein [Taishania pollutisoli]MBC9813447.1 rhodanese-like domain-containing protein [Taishania pollutisoli]MBX2950666.1 rhodanese-like domain-containing protein [Crocinitomicaceae bacterium]NGF76513.1 rhodanese-like domain-containing protein [Fluviicola sp. SGL-29]
MKSITVQELKSMIDNHVEHILIDVREQSEYDMANINGILIPTSEFANRYSEVPKEGKVIVQCRSGQRSANVIAWLEQNHGYENLYNLQGGIIAWAHEIDPDLTVG